MPPTKNLHLPFSPSALLLSSLRRPHASPLPLSSLLHHANLPLPSHRRSAGTNVRMRGIKMKPQVISEKSIPHDVGLLDGTFVMPSQPSFFRSPRVRLRLYIHRLKKLYENTRLMLNWPYGTQLKPRPKIHFFRIHREAADLHQRVFSAFAAGDKKQLQSICCEGLFKDLSARIDKRGAGKQADLSWKLHRYRGFPRVMSSRATVFPGVDNTILRQHVVRIRSVQGLQSGPAGPDAQEAVKKRGKHGKVKVVNYMVVQKRILLGKEGPWKIWGMVKETEVKEVVGEPGKKVSHIAIPQQ